jgi:glycosyltransferase involved in cell wall biosynthesis
MQALLTVAIPTYNRPEPLSHTLDGLCSSTSSQFEILICDDSSDQRVQDLVARYQEKFSKIRYVRNPVNLGFNANVAQLYELTSTPYVWFLCDDDTIFEDSVSKIISSLEKHQPTVSIFNCSWINSYGVESLAGVREDRLYKSLDVFDSYDVLMRMTFLSILVYQKREGLIEVLKKSTNFRDNVFVQLSLGLSLLSENFRLCESSEYILHRNVGYRYGEFYKFILLDPLKAVFQMPNAFDGNKFITWSIKNLPENMLLFLSQKIGLFQFIGKPSNESKILLKKYYGRFSPLINLSRTLLDLVPASLIRCAFMLRLCSIHGLTNGPSVYKKLVNRASKDQRETAFTTYQ